MRTLFLSRRPVRLLLASSFVFLGATAIVQTSRLHTAERLLKQERWENIRLMQREQAAVDGQIVLQGQIARERVMQEDSLRQVEMARDAAVRRAYIERDQARIQSVAVQYILTHPSHSVIPTR